MFNNSRPSLEPIGVGQRAISICKIEIMDMGWHQRFSGAPKGAKANKYFFWIYFHIFILQIHMDDWCGNFNPANQK